MSIVQNNKRSVTVLDCTFRDGGYYLNWDFDESLVAKYLHAMVGSGVDIVEIGFRFLSTNGFLGAFAFSTDEYLREIKIPKELSVAVMVNASELIDFEEGVERAVELLFAQKEDSPVDIVRIAVNVDDIDKCYEISEKIHQLGYRVFLNIMKIDLIEESQLNHFVKKIQSWSTVEVLYFADSFGSMNPVSVRNIVNSIRKYWDGEIGIHAHNNKGIALINSLEALDAGAGYIDATVSGMGRGAGNVKIEDLLIELVERGFSNYSYDAVLLIALRDFKLLHEKYRWGSSIYYYLAAIHKIHPTYVQNMISDDRYGVDQILSTIDSLKLSKASSFSKESLDMAANGMIGDENGEWSSRDWFSGRTVLILSSGPGVVKYIEQLKRYIKKHKPMVLCINLNESVPIDMVDAFVACHEIRILIESSLYPKLNKPIILPVSRSPKDVQGLLQQSSVLDYGLRVEEGSFLYTDKGCILSAPFALMYAISIANSGQAKNILIAGADGYLSHDSRQLKMIDMLKKYKVTSEAIPLTAITPTTYPINSVSLFDKNLDQKI
ncbi:MAG: aldolase catalytic domain-containing protein [Proteobacteria bacterium]|nr:aldolase catalytic domain-containing protein [Pseudomonadota bacterium]MCH9749779.1 aldolase catalytic domain-containing protein [Pseudomonadota bacterium]